MKIPTGSVRFASQQRITRGRTSIHDPKRFQLRHDNEWDNGDPKPSDKESEPTLEKHREDDSH